VIFSIISIAACAMAFAVLHCFFNSKSMSNVFQQADGIAIFGLNPSVMNC